MNRRLFLAGAAAAAGLSAARLSGAAWAHSGHEETEFGKPGDPAKPARIVQVVMREADGRMLYLPDRVTIRKGEQVRFQLRNNGAIDHEFVIGTVEENRRHMKAMEAHPDMEHDDPNAKRLKPRATGEIVWQFTRPGTFEFACLIPGHYQAGMVGTIVVE
jgi:uncharacterized cupredoxin-like copper-binding protein